jgi:hypothetical protein
MPSLTRTRSITAHLTPDEHKNVAQKAISQGCSPGEYARRQLLDSLAFAEETRFLGAELLAFQETFLALILASLRGEDLDGERVARIRSRFDSVKESLVERAIQKRSDAGRKERSA